MSEVKRYTIGHHGAGIEVVDADAYDAQATELRQAEEAAVQYHNRLAAQSLELQAVREALRHVEHDALINPGGTLSFEALGKVSAALKQSRGA